MKKLILLPITLITVFSLNNIYGQAREEDVRSEATEDATLLDIRQAIANNNQLIQIIISNQVKLERRLIEIIEKSIIIRDSIQHHHQTTWLKLREIENSLAALHRR